MKARTRICKFISMSVGPSRVLYRDRCEQSHKIWRMSYIVHIESSFSVLLLDFICLFLCNFQRFLAFWRDFSILDKGIRFLSFTLLNSNKFYPPFNESYIRAVGIDFFFSIISLFFMVCEDFFTFVKRIWFKYLSPI